MTHHTIIVGLGAMGSAAAYQLAKRGKKVLGIDQFVPPHVLGSTHGETRITRQAIGEGAAYTPLALRSHEIWRDLELATGTSLLTQCGGLIIAPTTGVNMLHGKTDFVKNTISSAEQYDIPHELLSGEDARRRFPQMNIGDGDQVYFEPGAGFLRPERCIESQLKVAKQLGAEIHTEEKVIEFSPSGDGVRVVIDVGEYYAEKLILTAGPWAASMLGREWASLFKVYRQVLYWFSVDRPESFAPDRFPIFIWDMGGGNDMYGFPAVDGGSSIKVATELYNDETTAESVDRTVHQEEVREMYTRRIAPYLNGVKDECVAAATCLYTFTPDSNFIIDTLPDHPQIIIASPCSGHGFKHSAAVGEALAELATVGSSTQDISSFSLSRFL